MDCRSLSTILCGVGITMCLSDDRNVYSFGYTNYHIHGHEEMYVYTPKMLPSLKNIKSISVGDLFHTACLDYDGNIYTFGCNFFGQLGIGVNTSNSTCIPQRVNLPPCTQVSCGNKFTICLEENGNVYSFGNNDYGQLGLGNNTNFNSPQLIFSLKDVEFIESGGTNYVFCKTKDDIFCWGANESMQLGIGHTDNRNTPTKCISLSNHSIVDIKNSISHTLVLTSNGDVLSCGDNYYGQLGIEKENSATFQKIENLSEIMRIECGNYHSLCIDINKDLYVVGGNSYGQLGLGDAINRFKPIKHPSLSNIIDISKGGNHTFVKTSNNEIYTFGHNVYSQLGIKTEGKKQLTPIRVFEDNEEIWYSNTSKSKAKSARSILPRPSNEEDNSPAKKKQKTK